MDKKKHNARQARYRAKKARLELMVSEELREQFRTLPGTEDMSNADKLQALCELWTERSRSENESDLTDDDNHYLISREAKKQNVSSSAIIDAILTELQPVNAVFPIRNDFALSNKLRALYQVAHAVYMSVSRDSDIEKAKSILDPEREANLSAYAQRQAQPETLPLFPDDDLAVLQNAVDDMGADLSREAFQDSGIADNKDKLAFYLNQRAKAIYEASEHATEARTAGRHERAKKVIEDSDALTEIKGDYGAAVAACFALELLPFDRTWWPKKSEEQKRFELWRVFQKLDY